ncbi:MAG: acetyltransferase [Parvularculaceae bacterium]
MQDVIIIGGGTFYRQLSRVLASEFADTHRLVGVVDDTLPAGTELEGGTRCLGDWSALLSGIAPDAVSLVLGVGYRDLRARRALVARATEGGYKFATLISPHAAVSADARVGEGAIVMAGAIVDVKASIGVCAFVDIGVKICENVRVGCAAYISAGAAIGGGSCIGDANFIGLNAVVADGVTTGDFVRIQAGALLHRDAPSDAQVLEARNVRIIPKAGGEPEAAA